MNSPKINHTSEDWGDRAIRWLKVYYSTRSMKFIARDLDEPIGLVKLWWNGGRPSRQKLQKLAEKFRHESFGYFVFGFASKEEVAALAKEAVSNIIVLRDYMRAA